ncbi:uncharacterized protein [Palaemon carinicauda]|uniref:uncharacterized protein isoform X2 n=1 Tax=Palaemon carinicauda TaxID=392227 RepID=UPI0035B61596
MFNLTVLSEKRCLWCDLQEQSEDSLMEGHSKRTYSYIHGYTKALPPILGGNQHQQMKQNKKRGSLLSTFLPALQGTQRSAGTVILVNGLLWKRRP